VERSDLAKRFFIAGWERERSESQERERERGRGLIHQAFLMIASMTGVR
jgi:hypothetical protein